MSPKKAHPASDVKRHFPPDRWVASLGLLACLHKNPPGPHSPSFSKAAFD